MIRKDLSPVVLYGAARFPIADIFLTQFYDSASIVGQPGGITNFSHCNVADKQIREARTEIDPAKQIALWQEAQRLILKTYVRSQSLKQARFGSTLRSSTGALTSKARCLSARW